MVFLLQRGRVRGGVGPVLAAVSGLLAVSAVPAVAASAVPPPVRPEDRAGDHLTVVVRQAGSGRDGTYELSCHPAGGSHPDAAEACRVLDEHTRWGKDLFAPVAPGTTCTMLYGGPATARVTGTWAGRRVAAGYDRSNGCEIGRWDGLVPLLPRLGSLAA
ncbi:SSI family serine proteinase inhibitor [Streptomyces filipinensis]|uniref:SSI family serine proteinase inhibitor n=1 Tax=Streptomyces filipinensis TaxID=66887 RepID=UPI00177DCB17|nr:SSI family serine proteinase inhibitor [Streptomyces filipinensis]